MYHCRCDKVNEENAEGAMRECVMGILWGPQTLRSPPTPESTMIKEPTASSEIYHDICVEAMLPRGLLLASHCTWQDY